MLHLSNLIPLAMILEILPSSIIGQIPKEHAQGLTAGLTAITPTTSTTASSLSSLTLSVLIIRTYSFITSRAIFKNACFTRLSLLSFTLFE